MADHAENSRELENNSWVIASSETLPVEDLSSEAAEPENERGKGDPQAPLSDSKLSIKPLDSEEPKLKDPEVVLSSSSEAKSGIVPAKTPEPDLLEKESSLPHTEETGSCDAEAGSSPAAQAPLRIRRAGPLEEPANTSSAEEDAVEDRDVEGLRRRKGRDKHSAGPAATHHRHEETVAGEDSALPGAKWLLGLLAIFAVGILAFSGVVFDVEEGPMEIMSTWPSSEGDELHPDSSGKDWPAELSPEATGEVELPRAKEVPPSVAPTDTQSLDAMGQLLDKLAKENQGIRLMQAELQAQKEELQGLLRKTEGETLEFIAQQKNLAAENSRLSEALQRETSALLAAQAELRHLRQKLEGLSKPSEAQTRQPQEEPPVAGNQHDKAARPEAEIQRLRSLLASVRQDLVRASQQAPPGDAAEGLQKVLGDVQERLLQELARPERERVGKPAWRESHKAKRGKEKAWHKQHDGPEEPRPGPHEDRKEHRSAHKPPKVPSDGPQHHWKHGTRNPKAAKGPGHHHAARKAKKPAEPSALWEMLRQHRFRAPQGCTGVTECAQQEGLVPVQKTSLLPLVQKYLAGLGWAEHYGGLVAALDHFFDLGGVFAHDRLSFVDFLDEIEDALEDLAEGLGGSSEEVDDFEAVVLQQLGAAPGGRFTQRNGAQRHPKERNRDAHSHKNGREGAGRLHG
ncbi:hypothetical protein lerEdw1_002895 [Lerista edwardsae]|nr:hypothetical protein lerEdw1_002895 [Lerista edwardsae]